MQSQKLPYQTYYSKYRKYYNQRINPFVRSKHASAYTMIILSIFTVSFFGMFAIRPTIRTIVELKRQIQDNKEIDQALQNKINSLMMAQEEYQFITDFVPAINEALPDQPNIAGLLVHLDKLATEKEATITGLQVQSISFKPPTSSTTDKTKATVTQPTTIDIMIKLSGNYQQLLPFLEKLLTMRRTVVAKSLEITPEGVAGQANLKLLLRLNSYYLK